MIARNPLGVFINTRKHAKTRLFSFFPFQILFFNP
nr:MAG TPA: hypothetical protein [Caudoviricetes sp.]